MLVGFIVLVLNGITSAERPLFYVLGSALIFVGCAARIESAIRTRHELTSEKIPTQ